MPSATSSAVEPVGMNFIGSRTSSPRRITVFLPNCLSICARANSSDFDLSLLRSTVLVGAATGSPLSMGARTRRALLRCVRGRR